MENENNESSEDQNRRSENQPVLNVTVARELTKAQHIAARAQEEPFAAELVDRGIEAADVDTLSGKIALVEEEAHNATDSTRLKEAASANEDAIEKALLASLQEVQAAAKQAFSRSDPFILRSFYVGKKLNTSRAKLESYSAGIIQRAGEITLPGITQEKIDALSTLRTAYLDIEDTQSTKQSVATDQRTQRDELLDEVKAGRIAIQYAMDAQHPYHDKASAGTRKAFYLPLTRPFTG